MPARKLEWKPNPGPQTALFETPAGIILYGGAKGGGKTDGGLVWATRDFDKDGYKALILRKNFPELERHIIPRSRALFAKVGEYDKQKHIWHFPTKDGGEATLEFGFLERESDVEKYQGVGYARIIFDESTRFSEQMIRTMFLELRSPVAGIQRQLLLATNPIGPGFGFHKLMFIGDRRDKLFPPRKPFQLYWDTRWPSDGKPISAKGAISTVFIPSKLWDNPVLLKNDPTYPDRIRSANQVVVNALLGGSWDTPIGLALDFEYGVHTCLASEVPEYGRNWMAIDWGVNDIAATGWFRSTSDRTFLYRELARPGVDIVPYAHQLLAKCHDESIDYCVLSHEAFAKKGVQFTQAQQFAGVLSKIGHIPLIPSDKDREGRLTLVREFMRTSPVSAYEERKDMDYNYWVQKFAKEGAQAMEEYQLAMQHNAGPLPKLLISRDCPYVISSIPNLVVDKERPSVVADGQDDHGYDMLGYGLKAYRRQKGLPAELIYATMLDGRVPDSNLAADKAMEEARRVTRRTGGSAPFRWMGRGRGRS
jgi:hypothetical protein